MPVEAEARVEFDGFYRIPERRVVKAIADEMDVIVDSIEFQTPVRTGRLFRSTGVKIIRDKIVSVGWETPYAQYVEARLGVIAGHVMSATVAAVRGVRKLIEDINRRPRDSRGRFIPRNR